MAEVPFPWDLWREILLGLPSKSVIRFRAVCKSWLSIIDDPCFVRAHTNKQLPTILIRNSTGSPFYPLYSFDLETLSSTNGRHKISATPLNFTRSGLSRLTDLHTVATCNGLMLIAPNGSAENWEIWNPLTHERLELPQRNFKLCIDATGLGYDSANDDYKAVVIDCESYRSQTTVLETHVYSLKSDSWRKIMDYPRGKWAYGSPGVFLSGALHWISSSHDHYKIIALDIGTESYRELTMPPYCKLNEDDYNEMPWQCQVLDVLSGCLVVSDAGEDAYFDLWVRMDYAAEDSWTKVFKLNGRYSLPMSSFLCLRPVAYVEKKNQVFLQVNEGCSEGFCLFDLESGSVKMVSIHGLCGHLSAQVFHGTIFRLHDNCGGGRRQRKITSKSKMKMADTELIFCVRDPSWSNSHYCCM